MISFGPECSLYSWRDAMVCAHFCQREQYMSLCTLMAPTGLLILSTVLLICYSLHFFSFYKKGTHFKIPCNSQLTISLT